MQEKRCGDHRGHLNITPSKVKPRVVVVKLRQLLKCYLAMQEIRKAITVHSSDGIDTYVRARESIVINRPFLDVRTSISPARFFST
ncbi:unnamed protein product [Haemonchus placei]|uniref:Uncharacterized protein n=1 Tax=Haemonchus placei TaxID=6290 RepID=A0A3P7VUT7_HAEPC|nr:unnamed protein product [Haemonchus placei]